MKRFLSLFVAGLFCCSWLAAEEATGENPSGASAILDIASAKKANETYLAAVKVAKTKYVQALQAIIEAEQKKGNLDNIDALMPEIDKMLEASLEDSEAEFEIAAAKKAQEIYRKDVSSARKVYLSDLTKAQSDEVKAGNLEGAREIKEFAAALKAKTQDDTSGNAANKQKPTVKGGMFEATIYANCDDMFTIYLSGKEILRADRCQSATAKVQLRTGDRIVAKATNTGGGKGFACIIKIEGKKKFIKTDAAAWKSYTPKDETKWHDTKGIVDFRSVLPADNYSKEQLSLASGLPCLAIWGTGDPVSYLSLDITDKVMEKY